MCTWSSWRIEITRSHIDSNTYTIIHHMILVWISLWAWITLHSSWWVWLCEPHPIHSTLMMKMLISSSSSSFNHLVFFSFKALNDLVYVFIILIAISNIQKTETFQGFENRGKGQSQQRGSEKYSFWFFVGKCVLRDFSRELPGPKLQSLLTFLNLHLQSYYPQILKIILVLHGRWNALRDKPCKVSWIVVTVRQMHVQCVSLSCYCLS